jgi:hypothetical protein
VGPAGRGAASFTGFFRTTFVLTALTLTARRVDARAVLAVFALFAVFADFPRATTRLRPFVLFFGRRLSFLRTRFAMTKIPFKCLTGFG